MVVQPLRNFSADFAFRQLRCLQLIVLICLCWSVSGVLISHDGINIVHLSAGLGIWFGLLCCGKLALSVCSVLISKELVGKFQRKIWLDVALTLIMDITGIVFISSLSQVALFSSTRRFHIYVTIGSVFVGILLDMAHVVRDVLASRSEDGLSGLLMYHRQKTALSRETSNCSVQITDKDKSPEEGVQRTAPPPKEELKLSISDEDLDSAKKNLRKSSAMFEGIKVPPTLEEDDDEASSSTQQPNNDLGARS